MSFLPSLRRLDAGSALALLCGSVALLLASFPEGSFLSKPLAALGLASALAAGLAPALWKRENPIASLVAALLCLAVMLGVGEWPFSSAAQTPPVASIPLDQKGMAARQPIAEDDWTDAGANAVQKEDIRVQVVSARIGRVELKNRTATSLSSDRYLMVRLRVSFEGVLFRQVPYRSWAERADVPSDHPATLSDEAGQNYQQKMFAAPWKVAGRADADALTPGHQVKEVLVFAAPPRDATPLRLTLPGSAFGLAGAFRFRIPRSMIQIL